MTEFFQYKLIYVMARKESEYSEFNDVGFFIGDDDHLLDCFGVYPYYVSTFANEHGLYLKVYSIPIDDMEEFCEKYGTGDEPVQYLPLPYIKRK